MRLDVVTLFPELFDGPLDISVLGRARRAGVAEVTCHDLRRWTHDPHRTVDDTPYGGGAGMVMKPEPLFEAVRSLQAGQACPVVYTTPQGEPLTQRVVAELAAAPRIIILCGRYEGIDERVCEGLVTHQVSIGDYVLSGGELPALVLVDAVVRLLPGALGNEESAQAESFSDGLLEHPHYTRPPEFEGLRVPDELVNGDHAAVAAWRRAQSLRRTLERRPDLLATAELSEKDYRLLADVAGQDA